MSSIEVRSRLQSMLAWPATSPRGAEHEESNAEVTVNGRIVSVPGTASVLEACHAAGVSVPTLCKDPRLPTTPGTCRLCLVDVGGNLQPACATPVRDGMAIATDTTETRSNIKSVLSFLRANHPNDCMTCEANGRCEFQDLLNRYQVEDVRPKLDHLRHREASTGPGAAPRLRDSSSLAVELDMEKCLKCGRCVTACSAIQDMNILGFLNRGRDRHPGVLSEMPLEVTKCIECGQCTAVCPVAAVHERVEWREVMEKLESRTKVMVVQTAPAVRVAIGEEMGLAPGSITTGQMVAAQRELGFDYVFDTNFGADLTILEEGTELLARLQHKWAVQEAGAAEQAAAVGKPGPLPMFTSCCPAWINACEKSYPEILPLLSSCKSPHMMLGSVAKRVWARRRGLDPADVCVVSVMPCTAKKHEADRPQMSLDGVRDVDHVITTREFGRMLRHRRIPLASLPPSDFDDPMGRSTGAAALFGASGGVMEAAIRTVYELASGREMPHLDLHEVRGMAGVKSATVTLPEAASRQERQVRVAVASGIKNAKRILEDMRAGHAEYDFIEVMACPGGCVGGGGQPKTKQPTAILDRLHAIYSVDQGMPLRKSHDNPSVQQLYRQELGCAGSRLSRTLLHTTYDDKSHVTMPPGSAWGTLWQEPRGLPMLVLVLMKGHPGTGKSSVAESVCRALKWPLIDKDDARNGLSALEMCAGADLNAVSYDIMWRAVETQLRLGMHCVVDSPLARYSLYQKARDIAAKVQLGHLVAGTQYGAETVVVECAPSSTAEWRRRLEARGAEALNACTAHKPQSWEQLQGLLQRYEGCWHWSTDGTVDLHHHIVLDTAELSRGDACGRVVSYLQAMQQQPGLPQATGAADS